MNSRKAFLQEVYGPDAAPHQMPAERNARSNRADEARDLATQRSLPQRIIDRAASYAADGDRTAEQAVEAAIVADHEHTPTLDEALRHPDAFVDGMEMS